MLTKIDVCAKTEDSNNKDYTSTRFLALGYYSRFTSTYIYVFSTIL